MNLALKVDVDTYQGTLEGVPRLLDLFAKLGVRATFFFSLGPDRSGRAIRRVFRKGFVKKVLSASPAASYGLKTMLYGTLLPAPDVGSKPAAVARMRETVAAGHTVGIHAWDHVGWHDRLPEMTREEIEDVVAKEHARFREVFGFPATLSAAPGWTATPLSVEVQEAYGVTATSDTRGGRPFFPVRADGSVSKVLEIPSTLPTLDELLALPLPGDGTQVERACELLRMKMRNPDAPPSSFSFEVHSIHTEIEGGPAFSAPFARLLAAWKGEGVAFLTFEEILKSLRPDRSPAGGARVQSGFPVRRLSFTTLPGRATPVVTGWAGG